MNVLLTAASRLEETDVDDAINRRKWAKFGSHVTNLFGALFTSNPRLANRARELR